MKLSRIFIYPIKSLGHVELDSSDIDLFGLKHDRRWMLVTSEGKAITQREYPSLAQFVVDMKEKTINVTSKSDKNLSIIFPHEITEGDEFMVKIWDDTCRAIKASSNINKAFSKALNMEVTLVYMPNSSGRLVNNQYAQYGEITSFSDGFPILLLSEDSMDYLNSKLSDQIDIIRFRPNLVFKGSTPHCEDQFKSFRIGDAQFKAVKPCSRCVITTIDPQTLKAGKEPLKTLNTYRNINGKVMFGMNVLIESANTIRVGDALFQIS